MSHSSVSSTSSIGSTQYGLLVAYYCADVCMAPINASLALKYFHSLVRKHMENHQIDTEGNTVKVVANPSILEQRSMSLLPTFVMKTRPPHHSTSSTWTQGRESKTGALQIRRSLTSNQALLIGILSPIAAVLLFIIMIWWWLRRRYYRKMREAEKRAAPKRTSQQHAVSPLGSAGNSTTRQPQKKSALRPGNAQEDKSSVRLQSIPPRGSLNIDLETFASQSPRIQPARPGDSLREYHGHRSRGCPRLHPSRRSPSEHSRYARLCQPTHHSSSGAKLSRMSVLTDKTGSRCPTAILNPSPAPSFGSLDLKSFGFDEREEDKTPEIPQDISRTTPEQPVRADSSTISRIPVSPYPADAENYGTEDYTDVTRDDPDDREGISRTPNLIPEPLNVRKVDPLRSKQGPQQYQETSHVELPRHWTESTVKVPRCSRSYGHIYKVDNSQDRRCSSTSTI
ncbi:hypothetical protein VTO42DRAFT_472 [Malbranchea cinnamomea]